MTTATRIPKKGVSSRWLSWRSDESAPALHQRTGWMKRVIAKFESVIAIFMPVGYQDQTGFHYGEQPLPQQSHRR